MTYEITKNTSFNSLEISFDSKPDEKIREILKSLKFRWHNTKKLWYGYAEEKALRLALGEEAPKEEPKTKKAEKVNKYGVKIGDIFSASWGYEQTNVNFFQVVALVGELSVRVREVFPEITEEKAVSGMSADYTYKLTNDLLPPASRSIFIEDQENGDVKRLKAGWGNTPEEAAQNCSFKLDTFANAHKRKMKKYTVIIVSENDIKRDLIDFDTFTEAEDFCNQYDWLFPDENNFHWEMYIRYNRPERSNAQ